VNYFNVRLQIKIFNEIVIHSDYYICRHTGPRADTDQSRADRLRGGSTDIKVDSLRQDENNYIDRDLLLVTATFTMILSDYFGAIQTHSEKWCTSN
jgi:hypothetical protein